MAPVFLSLAEVLEIHRDQIERYGGEPGVRDQGLLESAVIFPALNDLRVHADEEVFEKAVRSVAEGKWGKPLITEFFRNHSSPPG